ncbi:MAG: metallophosphoesterase family protein, partial [Paludibacteraceae bacterium]
VRGRGIRTIMGNHDYAMVYNKGFIARSKTCTKVLSRQLTYITPNNLRYLSHLPHQLEIHTEIGDIVCVHGGLLDAIDEYIDELSSDYFKGVDERTRFVITAHSHKAMVKSFGGILYGNSGSVGQPRDHDNRASYLVWDNGEMKIHRVVYDIEQTRKVMCEYGFEDYISEVLYKGYRIGE